MFNDLTWKKLDVQWSYLNRLRCSMILLKQTRRSMILLQQARHSMLIWYFKSIFTQDSVSVYNYIQSSGSYFTLVAASSKDHNQANRERSQPFSGFSQILMKICFILESKLKKHLILWVNGALKKNDRCIKNDQLLFSGGWKRKKSLVRI